MAAVWLVAPSAVALSLLAANPVVAPLVVAPLLEVPEMPPMTLHRHSQFPLGEVSLTELIALVMRCQNKQAVTQLVVLAHRGSLLTVPQVARQAAVTLLGWCHQGLRLLPLLSMAWALSLSVAPSWARVALLHYRLLGHALALHH